MTALHYLFAWANAPYTVAAGVAMLFALLQATGVLGLLAGGGDHDADVDADMDADADADVDHDHDVDADHDHDVDADGRGIGAVLLGPLGFGRIPFSLVWQTYAIVFAITGFVLNMGSASPPIASLLWTVPISLVTGYVGVAALARVLGPVLSSRAQEATTRAELVGQVGVVISSRVTADFGEVRVKDKSGHEIRIICKLAAGVREPKEREQVVFVEYDEQRGLLVSPMDRVELVPEGAPLGGEAVEDQDTKNAKRAG